MNYRLCFSQQVKPYISGAVPFVYSLDKQIKPVNFKKQFVDDSILPDLCQSLDSVADGQGLSIQAFFEDKKISIGPRRNIRDEITRVLARNDEGHICGLLLALPFKCPVPIKTYYHSLPDLGELLFLHRISKFPFPVTILDESHALSVVFGVKQHTADLFRNTLLRFMALLNIEHKVRLIPLHEAMGYDRESYRKAVKKEAQIIEDNIRSYQDVLSRILPTIALSMHTTHLSLNECSAYMYRLFSDEISPISHPELFQTAYRYIAFSNLQKKTAFRKRHYSNFLQMSLCPKKGRVGIRPTVHTARIWPHHGVPVVRKNKLGKSVIEVMYFIDLIHAYYHAHITQVFNKKGFFLYFLIDSS